MPNPTAQRLVAVIESVMKDLIALSEEEVSSRPQADKWSRKEIIGHLIDSATNNHQRFVRAHLQENLVFLGYQQAEWVNIHRYQESEWQDLITLWYALNHHIARVMEATPESVLFQAHSEHNFHPIGFVKDRVGDTATIHDFMVDYVDHLEHHLRQIFPGKG